MNAWSAKTSLRDPDRRRLDMPSIALKVTNPPSSTAADPMPDSARPLFRGTGGTDYVCGNCGSVMAAGMGPTQHVIVDTAVCSACGAENEFPTGLRS